MKFTIAIAAIVALVPIALAASSADNSAAVADPAPTEFDNSPVNKTVAVAGVDFDDSPLNDTTTDSELVERKVTKNSGLTIRAYRNKGCSGPLVPFSNVQYDHAYGVTIKSYSTSRRLRMGEVLNLYGKVGNNRCGRVTSHTPQIMGAGCHPLGGGSVEGASCFKLWRHMGFIYKD
ncbi:MAG: hypothetical protein Q9166_003363 [cf. Caloplaca sp. 2 TL-2023]